MQEIKGWVRNGHIETEEPVSLPEGTELRIRAADSVEGDDDWDNSPEGIRDWLEWYETLEPLILTDDERAIWEPKRP